MTPTEYVKRAVALESNDYPTILARIPQQVWLLHALLGMCTETGEIQDQLKKHLFYGRALDRVNLKEEIGDILWYIALACHDLGISLEEVMLRNIEKLEYRYANTKFQETQALNRNLDKEREIIERREQGHGHGHEERTPTPAENRS